ncbi:MAG: DUF3221 domain-containing protein [Gemmatimonadaceae bacterium]|nr:DUF3221 domain-containing protein [Gemmatimonadaceae bacterium]
MAAKTLTPPAGSTFVKRLDRTARSGARARRATWATLAVVALAIGVACTDAPTAASIPAASPGISGRITSIVQTGTFSGRVLVEFAPNQPNTGPKALVTVTGTTTIFVVRQGNSAYDPNGEFRSLTAGQWVRVWFNGPVAESYPVQGTAGSIAIDSTGQSVSN